MNQLLEERKANTDVRRRTRFARIFRDDETQSLIVGLILTLIFWPLLVAGFSWSIGHLHGKPDVRLTAVRRPQQFNIEIAPEAFTAPKPKPPNRFVETNPNAPENIPDKTRNFAAQNQQAAQPKPSPKTGGDHPATKGRTDVNSAQIVSGNLSKTQVIPSAPTPPQTSQNSKAQVAPRREQNPLPGFEKIKGEDKDAFGGNVAKIAENSQDVPKKVEGQKNVPLIEGANSNMPQIDPKHPLPRPRLDRNVRPAIFSQNPVGTSNIGLAAWDARWNSYGEYLQRLIDVVQAEWDNLLSNAGSLPPSGSKVIVTFRINSQGKISKIVKVDSTAGDLGSSYCVSAITDRSPYDKWSEDMVTTLGDEQELTFTFFYL
ncbi:MAG: hypothetical protein KGJ37_00575 [Verrucomicrobiota bacterium]|nr:hypothetical protein [Verrucomicrobiota bacterium]